MKTFLVAQLLILNSYLFSENLKYKKINNNEESTHYSTLKYPKDCEKILDIKRAKKIGAKGVLVSSILHENKLNKLFIQKEKTSL